MVVELVHIFVIFVMSEQFNVSCNFLLQKLMVESVDPVGH